MNSFKIIGISGTDGSGKDTVGEILSSHGWKFVSVTDLLRAEAARRKVRLGRDTLRQISAEWRRNQGLGVLVDKAVETYKDDNMKYAGLVLASLRNPGENDRIHELKGMVIWVDADPKVRFERIKNRNRGTEDQVTFEEFLAEEKVQSRHSGDEATLSLDAVKQKADIYIENNGTMKEFRVNIEKSLRKHNIVNS